MENGKIIKNFRFKYDRRKILRRLGYKKKSQNPDDSLLALIREGKQRCQSLIKPASIYSIINYEDTNKHSIFQDAEKVALSVCTIGHEIDKHIDELFKKDETLNALIFDAIGSEAINQVALQTDHFLAFKARKMNLWASKRFSPGYKQWELNEQKFVFQKVPAQKIGVKLLESFMMIPRKSTSFRINFYKNKSLTTRRYPKISMI